MSKVAEESGLQRETLYRSLSEKGNPTLDTLTGVLAALNLKIELGTWALRPRLVYGAPSALTIENSNISFPSFASPFTTGLPANSSQTYFAAAVCCWYSA
jgi:transcriptional regulator with XRE-family HTH domain